MKSQIHAGGRGKGKFKELPVDAKGGVRLAKSIDEVAAFAERNARPYTCHRADRPRRQAGQPPYIQDGCDIEKEFYPSILVDRETSRVAFVVSTEGAGHRKVAHDTPEIIVTFSVHLATGVMAASRTRPRPARWASRAVQQSRRSQLDGAAL